MKSINEKRMQECIENSRKSKRKRFIYAFSKPEEGMQRMLNAIQPESYLPPHKHHDKTEVFVAVKGKFIVVEYEDDGKIADTVVIGEGLENKGTEVAPKRWHSVISLEKDSVAYEILDKPYVAETHKVFAEWAPKEEEYEKGMKFVEKIKKEVLKR